MLTREVWPRAVVEMKSAALHESQKSIVWKIDCYDESTQRTVIAKAIDPTCGELYVRERDLLVAAADLGVAPRLHAFDNDHRLLILEAVGAPGDGAALAGALAELHGSTRGVGGLPPSPHLSTLAVSADVLSAETKAVADALNVRWDDGVRFDVAQLLTALRDESIYCFTHGDVCVSNARLVDGAPRLVDFADAGRCTPAIDVAALQLGLPDCGRAPFIDESSGTALVGHYRERALARFPEWQDGERFQRFVGVGCGFWALRMLAGRRLDPRKVIATHRGHAPTMSRLLRSSAELLGEFPALRTLATSVETVVRTAALG